MKFKGFKELYTASMASCSSLGLLLICNEVWFCYAKVKRGLKMGAVYCHRGVCFPVANMLVIQVAKWARRSHKLLTQ